MNEPERTPFDCNRMRFSNLWYFVTKMPLTFVDGDSSLRTALVVQVLIFEKSSANLLLTHAFS